MNLYQLIEFLKPIKTNILDFNTIINSIDSIENINLTINSLTWCSDKNIKFLQNNKINGTIIVSEYVYEQTENLNLNLICVANPRYSFSEILKEFFYEKPIFGIIHTSSIIDESTILNKENVKICANVVIEKNVEIGKNVIINSNSVIKSNTIIHDNVIIGSNCTIGGNGFGYEKNNENEFIFIPHIGNVILHKNVEIGNNVCIDKAVLGSTILEENVKVDNLVHIAHGVKIGKNSLIIANSMIAGSVKIGENVWISPSSTIKQKVLIKDNSLVGLGSVVLKDVEENDVVAGVPAKSIKK
jgi:UDP-3-O-[3-hydroxymyristoyl] glucosamine N-acyltransferase